jgi:hypothetical protein
MAKLRVFVSSTCYDLGTVRSELRPFIANMGYEPVMSDFSDVLYDPKLHTHESCLKEIPNCDMVVLIIGGRFGGKIVKAALDRINFDSLSGVSKKPEFLDDTSAISITQAEVLQAIESDVPVFAFVDSHVLHDHALYEKNKGRVKIIGGEEFHVTDELEYPSINKPETARYIFEFINFLRGRLKNNGLTEFTRLDDIRAALLGQWSQLFQHLLNHARVHRRDEKTYATFAESLADLKAAVMASITTSDVRDIARCAVRYRALVNFIGRLAGQDAANLLLGEHSWEELVESAGYKISIIQNPERRGRLEVIMYNEEGAFRLLYNSTLFQRLSEDWESFHRENSGVRKAVTDALLGINSGHQPAILELVARDIEHYTNSLKKEEKIDPNLFEIFGRPSATDEERDI